MYKASVHNIRLSPRKARLVVDLIRRRNVVQALGILDAVNKKAAYYVRKVLKSAIANAEHRGGSEMDVDSLRVKTAYVDPGRVLKRFQPRAMGRGMPIRKRTSHIVIEVEPAMPRPASTAPEEAQRGTKG